MRLVELGQKLWGRRDAAASGPQAWAAPDAAQADPPAARVSAAVPPADPGAWTEDRVRIAERLWGEGFLAPGGSAELMRLALPLGLSAASSLLLLGAGSGGPALRLAADLGTWVHAVEADPYLTWLAARRVQQAGPALAKRTAIAGWDPQARAFRRRAFHSALVLDALRGPRIEDTLAAVAMALRPGGQIAMTQLVAGPEHAPGDPALRAWQVIEGRDGPFAAPEAVPHTLERLHFDVRVAEDVSRRHIRAALVGWRDLLPVLDAERPDAAEAAVIVAEAERWLRRLRLIRGGRLRMMRWLAIPRA